jgi:hypothetical protein
MSTGWFLQGVILPFIYGGWWSEQGIPLLTNQDAIEWHRDFEHCSIGMSWGWYSQSSHMMFGCGWKWGRPSKWPRSWRDNDDKQLEVEVITLFSSHLPIPTIATLKCYQPVFFWMSFLQKGECPFNNYSKGEHDDMMTWWSIIGFWWTLFSVQSWWEIESTKHTLDVTNTNSRNCSATHPFPSPKSLFEDGTSGTCR